MKIFENVFIGVVDILGYDAIEKFVAPNPKLTAETHLKGIFTILDQIISTISKSDKIEFHRYGDGYVFYSHEDDISILSELIPNASRLLALALNHHIPLRIAITQDSVNVDKNNDGLTFSGSGWEQLRELEKALDWMGGFLYLPNYDGFHHETITQLIKQTDLIIEQKIVQDFTFVPPFKEDTKLLKNKCWYLNWYKVLRQAKQDLDLSINSWWNQIDPTNNVNDHKNVKLKQLNTTNFAEYARKILESCNLVHHSNICKLPIEKITN